MHFTTGLLLAACLCAGSAMSGPFEGEKAVKLMTGDGDEIVVGHVRFTTADGAVHYEVDWDLDRFGDYFLSMRPFKCIEGPEKLWCRVPYPYEIRREVSAGDLTDLEYDTLFIWKKASDYGIDMWNGVYYKLEVEEDALVGYMNELDLDILSAPPDDGELRPVGEYDLEPADPDSHWLPVLRIE